MTTPDVLLDADTRDAVLEDVIATILQQHLFPAQAVAIAADLRRRHQDGEYAGVATARSLADVVTRHLRGVGHDDHLCLLYPAPPRPASGQEPPIAKEREERRRRGLQANFGFHRAERLAGNVGYLDVRGFHETELAGETAIAALRFLAHTAALIVDLRRNNGGDPEMVALLCSYFLGPEPVRLWDFRWREGQRVEQTWTLPYVPGPRYLDRPLYILTGRQTFSGAESFAYALKNRKRATVIGETTRGGGHYADGFLIQGLFGLAVPTAELIDPITGTNWEGTGVPPDIAVPEREALAVGHAAALNAVLESHHGVRDQVSQELQQEAEDALRVCLQVHPG
jgi:C-terminal processing protease CtpA/Prc